MLVTVSATVSLKIAVIRTFADNNHRLGAALYNGFAAQAILKFPGPGLRASFGWDRAQARCVWARPVSSLRSEKIVKAQGSLRSQKICQGARR
jgi:hypothetical protein